MKEEADASYKEAQDEQGARGKKFSTFLVVSDVGAFPRYLAPKTQNLHA